MRFGSAADFARHIERVLATLPEAERRGLDRGADVILKEVKSIPGEYQPGWRPLAASTIARKATGDSPLLETGEMQRSYGKKVPSNRKAFVGSDNAKAVAHELGTSRFPPRPVLAVAGARKGGKAAEAIGRTVHRHLASLPDLSGDYSE